MNGEGISSASIQGSLHISNYLGTGHKNKRKRLLKLKDAAERLRWCLVRKEWSDEARRAAAEARRRKTGPKPANQNKPGDIHTKPMDTLHHTMQTHSDPKAREAAARALLERLNTVLGPALDRTVGPALRVITGGKVKIKKAWTDEARRASAEARRQKSGGGEKTWRGHYADTLREHGHADVAARVTPSSHAQHIEAAEGWRDFAHKHGAPEVAQHYEQARTHFEAGNVVSGRAALVVGHSMLGRVMPRVIRTIMRL